MEETTISCFSSLIYLENFFCINRSYLLTYRRNRSFGNIVSLLTFFAVIASFAYGFFGDFKIYDKMFQSILALELLLLAIAARFENIFIALKRLDKKCNVEKTYHFNLRRRVERETLLAIASVIIDVIGIYVLKAETLGTFLFIIMFAAHEAETVFFALIIEGMNMRLLNLNATTPYAGSRVYRHVLMASNQINIEFTPRVLVMLGVVLFTTVSYTCAVLLMFSDKGIKIAVYLLWRELKSLYCLRRLCRASSNSETICQQLAFQLARKLAFDPAFDKAKRPQAHATMKRWYNTVLCHHPRYVRGSVLSIGLSTPLHLLDLSVNYVLIIIQIYVAYK